MKLAIATLGTAVAAMMIWIDSAAPDDVRSSGEERFLRLADGVEMAYADYGAGDDPALVFVHCGNCRKEIWRETLNAFSPVYRVVAMDLPGHGGSGANRERFTIDSFGADVAALVEHLKLPRVILVGNSLGGPVALEAAKRLGRERVVAVVAVETLHDVEQEWAQERWHRLLEGYRRDFPRACAKYMRSLLHLNASPEVRERIDRETCHNDPEAAISLLESLQRYDRAASLSNAAIPVWAINSDAWPTALEVNRKYALSFNLVIMQGVGHYPQIERPRELQCHLWEIVQAISSESPDASPSAE